MGTDSAAKDWTFAVDSKETLVVAKGGHHEMDKLKADGKPLLIDEFMAEKDKVIVKYGEKDGKMIAKEVHVKRAPRGPRHGPRHVRGPRLPASPRPRPPASGSRSRRGNCPR